MKPLHVLGLFLLGGLLIGCDSDTNSTTPVDTGLHLTLHFVNGYLSSDYSTWVVINSLDGDSILAVHYISGDTLLDVGNVGSRTTFSLATLYGYPSVASVRSFPDVPVRDWIFDGFDPYQDHEDTLGWADFTIEMPFQRFDWCKVVYTHSAELFSHSNDSTAPAHLFGPVRYLEDGFFSAYCVAQIAQNDSGFLDGFIIDQPFQIGDTNYYTIILNQAVAPKRVTLSTPVEFTFLHAYRGISDNPYVIDGYICPQKCSEIFLVGSAFPCDIWQMHFSNTIEPPFIDGYVQFTNFPSTVVIPDINMRFGFNSATGMIDNLTITGVPSLIQYCYYLRYGAWFVTADKEGAPNYRPVMPDSFLTSVGWDVSPLPRSAHTIAYVAEPADSYDEILSLMYDYYDPFRYESDFLYYFYPEDGSNTLSGDSLFYSDDDNRRLRAYFHNPFNVSPPRQYRIK